jgi:hypothetical protein
MHRSFTFLDSVLSDLYPACAEELYSDVITIECIVSFISVLYGFVPLETGIAHDSRFLGLSQRCRESSLHLRKIWFVLGGIRAVLDCSMSPSNGR